MTEQDILELRDVLGDALRKYAAQKAKPQLASESARELAGRSMAVRNGLAHAAEVAKLKARIIELVQERDAARRDGTDAHVQLERALSDIEELANALASLLGDVTAITAMTGQPHTIEDSMRTARNLVRKHDAAIVHHDASGGTGLLRALPAGSPLRKLVQDDAMRQERDHWRAQCLARQVREARTDNDRLRAQLGRSEMQGFDVARKLEAAENALAERDTNHEADRAADMSLDHHRAARDIANSELRASLETTRAALAEKAAEATRLHALLDRQNETLSRLARKGGAGVYGQDPNVYEAPEPSPTACDDCLEARKKLERENELAKGEADHAWSTVTTLEREVEGLRMELSRRAETNLQLQHRLGERDAVIARLEAATSKLAAELSDQKHASKLRKALEYVHDALATDNTCPAEAMTVEGLCLSVRAATDRQRKVVARLEDTAQKLAARPDPTMLRDTLEHVYRELAGNSEHDAQAMTAEHLCERTRAAVNSLMAVVEQVKAMLTTTCQAAQASSSAVARLAEQLRNA